MRCIDRLEASDLLEVIKEVLTPVLGTYRYKTNNFTEPSISIGNPRDDTEVNGLEVVIDLLPSTQRKTINGNGYTEKQKWRIYLIDRNQGQSLPEAIRLLDKTFTETRKVFYPASNDLDFPRVVYQIFYYQTTDTGV